MTIKRAWPFFYAAMLLGMIGGLNLITADDRHTAAWLRRSLVFIATVIDGCLTVFHLATGVDRRNGML